MIPSTMLALLEKGEIEAVKKILRDEIYMRSLKKNPNAKKRYVAMNKYFTYRKNSGRTILQKPCPFIFEGVNYTSFTNSHSLVLTTESAQNMELFNENDGNYPDVTRLIRFEGDERKIDIGEAIARARSLGYKLLHREAGSGYKYLMHYDGSYYNVGLVDISYRIIDDGKEVVAWHKPGKRSMLTLRNDIGLCVIMPIAIDEEDLEGMIVIDVNAREE